MSEPVSASMPAVAGFVAPAHAPGWLVLSALALVTATLLLRRAEAHTAPPRPEPAGAAGALRSDSPAVVNMLTNDATVTGAAFRATLIDLAARGWVRLLPPDDEDDELGRVRPSASAYEGDSLRPHERLVLQHVMARYTSDRAIPARYLAVDVHGSWWKRFRGLVEGEARESGLVRRRWAPADLLLPAGAWVLAVLTWWIARSSGDTEVAVIESVERRIVGWGLLLLVVALGLRMVLHLLRPTFTHTDKGLAATSNWLAVRQRLVGAGFADMAPSSIEVGDRRLAYATAMCLADGAAVELPLAREDARRAWSSVGGRARLVRVRYPLRPGYGMTPWVSLAVGVVLAFIGLQGRRWFADVARGEGFDWAYEQFPEQDWLIADVATALTFLAWLPIALGLWMALAGAADALGSVERTGVVVRARRPVEVSPLPRAVLRRFERDRYSLYIAIDDGTSDDVVAWRTNERNAVPQGANATVKASLVLGHVRRAVPVGHRIIG